MTTVRNNLMSIKGYSPYCGGCCHRMPRTIFDGEQFLCPDCGWRSTFPEEFIREYKTFKEKTK